MEIGTKIRLSGYKVIRSDSVLNNLIALNAMITFFHFLCSPCQNPQKRLYLAHYGNQTNVSAEKAVICEGARVSLAHGHKKRTPGSVAPTRHGPQAPGGQKIPLTTSSRKRGWFFKCSSRYTFITFVTQGSVSDKRAT